MKRLLHVHSEELAETISGVGTFRLAPNIAVIIDNDFYADKILEHLSPYGVVEVGVTKTQQGESYHLRTAKDEAAKALSAAEDSIVKIYVAEQQLRIQNGKAAIPPVGRTEEIIRKRNIDLAGDYDLHPVGYHAGKAAKTREEEFANLRKQNDDLCKRLDELATRIGQLNLPNVSGDAKSQPGQPPKDAAAKDQPRYQQHTGGHSGSSSSSRS